MDGRMLIPAIDVLREIHGDREWLKANPKPHENYWRMAHVNAGYQERRIIPIQTVMVSMQSQNAPDTEYDFEVGKINDANGYMLPSSCCQV